MATKVGELYYEITTKGAEKLDSAFAKAKGASFALLGGLTALGAAAVGVAKTSLDAWAAQEAASDRLRTVLKNVAGARKEDISMLEKQAGALQRVTRFSDEEIISAQAFLGTFRLTASQIKTVTPHLLDMAEALRRTSGGTIDLEQASNMLGKAIASGQLANLRRVGVTLSDTQMKLFKTASQEKRVAMITQILDQNFKGVAKSAGTTLAGAIDRAKNAFGEVQEEIGKRLAPVVENLTNRFMRFIDKLGGASGVVDFLKKKFELLQPYLPIIAGAILGGLVPAFVALAASIWSTIAPLIPFLAIGAAIGYVAKVIIDNWSKIAPYFEWVKTVIKAVAPVFDYLKGVIQNAMNEVRKVVFTGVSEVKKFALEYFGTVVKWVRGNWPLIKKTIQVIMTGIITNLKVSFAIIKGIFTVAWAVIKNVVSITWFAIKTIVMTALKVILGIIKAAMQIFTGDWKGAWKTLKEVAKTALDGLIKLIIGVATRFYNAGKEIISSFISGIKNAFKNAFKAVTDGVKKISHLLKPASPPGMHRWAEKTGFDVGIAWIKGITEGIKKVNILDFSPISNTLSVSNIVTASPNPVQERNITINIGTMIGDLNSMKRLKAILEKV